MIGDDFMATPFVTGVIALMLEQDPQLTIDQLRTTLSQNAIKDQHTSELAWTPEYGFGKISAARLIPQTGAQPAVAVAGIRAAPTQPRKRNRAVGKKQAAARHSGVRKVKKQAR